MTPAQVQRRAGERIRKDSPWRPPSGIAGDGTRANLRLREPAEQSGRQRPGIGKIPNGLGRSPCRLPAMDVLVIDIGGSHVKMLATGQHEPRRFESGEHLTPQGLVDGVNETAADWTLRRRSRSAFPVGRRQRAAGRAGQPRRRVGRLRLREGVRQAGPRDQRCRDAGAGRLRRRPHALPRPGHRPGLGPDRRARHRAAGARRLPYATNEPSSIGSARRASRRTARPLAGGGHTVTDDPALAFPPTTSCLAAATRRTSIRSRAAPGRGGNEDAFSGGFRLWEETVEPHDCRSESVWRVVR